MSPLTVWANGVAEHNREEEKLRELLSLFIVLEKKGRPFHVFIFKKERRVLIGFYKTPNPMLNENPHKYGKYRKDPLKSYDNGRGVLEYVYLNERLDDMDETLGRWIYKFSKKGDRLRMVYTATHTSINLTFEEEELLKKHKKQQKVEQEQAALRRKLAIAAGKVKLKLKLKLGD